MTGRDAIICVDDEPLVLKALGRALKRRLGHRLAIETASNGSDALELIEQLARDDVTTRVVVSDAAMPVMDGYELLARLHRSMPEVHKILVTGHADRAKIAGLFAESGLVAAFDKPWNTDELCAVIERKLAETSA
ncbi:MAG: response regulator [Myxococcales bacterium]|nr:response regulator [Myxococcales bacterium]